MEKIRIRGKIFVCLGVLVIVLAGCNMPFASPATPTEGVKPGTPVYEQFVMDCDTSELLEAFEPGEPIQPVPGCDSWEINRYERPFNADTQDEYFPDLDVLFGELGKDETWFYLNLALNDANEDTGLLGGTYGIEIDWDRDGRGDLLVAVQTPGQFSEDDWSVLGVQVWKDSNNDVGNAQPKEPDLPYEGDGYDLLVFNQGDGDDPDAAWARAVLDQSAYVEMAFKTNLLESPDEFEWWVWSDEGVVDPGGFDYHDTYDNEQAGDANDYLPYFPANQVFELDNTCASLWGLPPDDDPSLCINDPNFAYFHPPNRLLDGCLEKDEFLEVYYEHFPPPPSLTPAEEDMYWHLYLIHLGCERLQLTPVPTETATLPPPPETVDLCHLNDDGTYSLLNVANTPDLDGHSAHAGDIYPVPATGCPEPPPDTPTPTRPTCDFDCDCEEDQGENQYNCPKDCGETCGNGICGCGESPYNCKRDCGPPPCTCGDGFCNVSCGEDNRQGNKWCAEDCDGGAAPGGP